MVSRVIFAAGDFYSQRKLPPFSSFRLVGASLPLFFLHPTLNAFFGCAWLLRLSLVSSLMLPFLLCRSSVNPVPLTKSSLFAFVSHFSALYTFINQALSSYFITSVPSRL